LTSCAVRYPERDLNPHNRYGHRILSPACLPFHHPGKINLAVLQSCGRTVVPLCGRTVVPLCRRTVGPLDRLSLVRQI
jgi:hypothetical protein